MITNMSDSDAAIRIEHPLLEKWQMHAKQLKRLHGTSYSLFKGRANMALFTTVALSLGVGCLNLTYGIGQPSATTGMPAIVSAYFSLLLSGSVTAVSSGLDWPSDFASRYGEVVRDINTECTFRHMQGVRIGGRLHLAHGHRNEPARRERPEHSMVDLKNLT
jgi:hypothetical protein